MRDYEPLEKDVADKTIQVFTQAVGIANHTKKTVESISYGPNMGTCKMVLMDGEEIRGYLINGNRSDRGFSVTYKNLIRSLYRYEYERSIMNPAQTQHYSKTVAEALERDLEAILAADLPAPAHKGTTWETYIEQLWSEVPESER